MKLKLLILTGLCCGLSYGAVTFQGIVSNPTTDTGGALPAGTTAALVVDLDGSGVPASLNPFSVSVGGLLNGDLVAAITVSLSNFGISSISAQATLDLGAVVGGGSLDTGDSYYVIWFPGQTGTTSISGVDGDAFLAATAASWTIPADTGSNFPPSAGAPFIQGSVVPEPGSLLLLGLGSLAFLRRRR